MLVASMTVEVDDTEVHDLRAISPSEIAVISFSTLVRTVKTFSLVKDFEDWLAFFSDTFRGIREGGRVLFLKQKNK